MYPVVLSTEMECSTVGISGIYDRRYHQTYPSAEPSRSLGFLPAAWALASFFAVPLLAVENLSPGEVLQRSSSLIYKKWGEAVSAEFSFGLLFVVLALPGSLALSAAFYFGKFATLALPVVLAYWLVLAISTSAAKQVLVAALYRFANADEVTTVFGAPI